MLTNYKVPMIGKAFYTDAQAPAVRRALYAIKVAYGSLIAAASSLTDVPEELIASVIFIESAGRADAQSSAGALGLMQLKREAAEDALWLVARKGILSDQIKVALDKALGGKLAILLRRANLSVTPAFRIPSAWLVQANVSILIGSLLLTLLLKESEEKDGQVRLDKVIARYNQGYFYRPHGTTAELVAAAPKEAQAYVLKLVGVNSTLDLLAV